MAYVKWQEDGYLKKQSGKYLFGVLLVAIIGFLFYRSKIFHILPPPIAAVIGVLFLIGYFTLYVTFFKTHLHYEKGMAGERAVMEELCELPPGFLAFHDIVLPQTKENIDFVVVTPNHVYVLEVKNWKWPFVSLPARQARRGAKHLNEWLKKETGEYLFVQPVVVFVRPRHRVFSRMADGTGVVELSGLNDFIADKSGKVHETRSMIAVVQAMKRFTQVQKVVCD